MKVFLFCVAVFLCFSIWVAPAVAQNDESLASLSVRADDLTQIINSDSHLEGLRPFRVKVSMFLTKSGLPAFALYARFLPALDFMCDSSKYPAEAKEKMLDAMIQEYGWGKEPILAFPASPYVMQHIGDVVPQLIGQVIAAGVSQMPAQHPVSAAYEKFVQAGFDELQRSEPEAYLHLMYDQQSVVTGAECDEKNPGQLKITTVFLMVRLQDTGGKGLYEAQHRLQAVRMCLRAAGALFGPEFSQDVFPPEEGCRLGPDVGFMKDVTSFPVKDIDDQKIKAMTDKVVEKIDEAVHGLGGTKHSLHGL